MTRPYLQFAGHAPLAPRMGLTLVNTCAVIAATVTVAAAAPAAPGNASTAQTSVAASSTPPDARGLPVQADAPTPPVLVLESHVGGRPAAVSDLLDPLLDELERRGLAARPSTIARVLGERAPRPGVLDPGTAAHDLVARSRAGLEAYRSGAYRDAAATLGRVIAEFERTPALILDAANTSAVVRAYVGLALSQDGLGLRDESIATMTELLRTCASQQTIDHAEYGPHAEELFSVAKRDSRKLGRGELVVSVDEATAMVFIDNELHGTGHAAVAELIPGRHRVFVHLPRVGGRQYQVEVRAGRRSKLDIAWAIDSALTVGDTWTGLVFASEADRARESAYAGALAQRWGHATIAVITVASFRGEPSVIGTIYRGDSSVVRRAAVPIHAGVPALRALGRFLADGNPSTALEVFDPEDLSGGLTRDPIAPHGSTAELGVPGWPFVVTGALGIAAGAIAIAVDQDQGHRDPTGQLTPYYRNSAPLGVAACALGAAAITYGIWQWTHPRKQSSPTVSLGSDHVSLGWITTF